MTFTIILVFLDLLMTELALFARDDLYFINWIFRPSKLVRLVTF